MRRRGHGAGVVAIVGTAALLGSCLNAGQDRVLAIQATGIIKGLVYFDRDGNGVPDAADTALSGVTVRLIVSGTQDTVARAVSDTGGLLRFDGVPIGTIVVAVDSTTIPTDSLRITRIDVSTVKVTPGDSFAVRVAVSFPQLDVTNARTYALGKKVFVVGVALNNVSAFGDSTVHLADTTAAILLTGVRPLVAAGDSVRVLGTRRTRSGQPTLANPTIVGLSVGAATPSHQVTTALAAQA
ncbi:MAG TPA: SdrD B-like domain-containing protein, partial [Gemmatimonadales bacterium]|nr:SdrD B-like domain-containing protein [Gemmatimonadales bacterium]